MSNRFPAQQPAAALELQTKVKRRFAKILQSRRRPLIDDADEIVIKDSGYKTIRHYANQPACPFFAKVSLKL